MIALRNIRTIASAAVRKAVGALSVVPVRKAVAALNVATAACVVAALCGVTSCREMPDPADFYFESLKMNEVMVSKETLVLKLKADMAAGSKVVGERKFECWFELYTEPIFVDADENFSADLIPGFFGQNCSVKALFSSGSTRLESEPVEFRVLNFEEYVSLVESGIGDVTDTSASLHAKFVYAEGFQSIMTGCLLSEADPDFTDPVTFFSNSSGGAVDVELKPLKQGTTYYVKPFFREEENTVYGDVLTFTTATVEEYVDLGLPSGI